MTDAPLNICILGAGSLGSAMGGVLAQAGHNVTLVTRNAAHVDAINQQGLTLIAAGAPRTVRVRAVTHCQQLAAPSNGVDVLLVLVKSFHTEAALQTALHLVGANTAVLSLQNGLGHEAILQRMVGVATVLAGKTYAGGQLLAPGQVIDGTRNKETVIGRIEGGACLRSERIAQAFTAAGLTTLVSQNIATALWDKLLVNAATGALSAITGLDYGHLYAQAGLEATAIAVVAEGMAVASAAGIALTFAQPVQSWLIAGAGLPPEFKPSMLQSLEKGSITEIDFINGAIVAQGARFGVPTPVNAALQACVKALESKLEHRA